MAEDTFLGSLEGAKKMTYAFVYSHLNYSDALYSELSEKTIGRLQVVHKSAVRVLTTTKKRYDVSLVLASLHWLPVLLRTDFLK